jgi:hypothetical protein
VLILINIKEKVHSLKQSLEHLLMVVISSIIKQVSNRADHSKESQKHRVESMIPLKRKEIIKHQILMFLTMFKDLKQQVFISLQTLDWLRI